MKACCLLVLLTFAVGVTAAQSDYPLRKAVECTPRSGLPNFLAKISAGKSVKVAYLGGSITAAPGWRVKSCEWLQQTYPKANFKEIHAAIGGTGSDLGVFRLGRDVIQHQPDLLFVEFAVNDGGAQPDRIHKAMEGIVRQTWQADPKTDICYVYTLTERMLGDLQSGKMPRAASAMEELADHYGIPSIHFGVEVAKLEAAGRLIFKAPKPKDWSAKPMIFSSDGVHPHVQTGHQLYVEAIARSWSKIKQTRSKVGAHKLRKPLRPDNWEQAKMVSIQPEMLHGEWKKLPADHTLSKRFRRNMPELYQAVKPGATLSFEFEGITAGVFDILGPDGGQVFYQVNESKGATRNRIDGYCTYHRMSKLNLANELKPGVHRVEISLAPAKLDKNKILFERNRGDLKAKPEKYRDHTWYISSIMLIGDISR